MVSPASCALPSGTVAWPKHGFMLQLATCPLLASSTADTVGHVLQRRYSVAKIDNAQTYEKGSAKMGGLSDPRLGTMDRQVECLTDGCNVQASQRLAAGYCLHERLQWQQCTPAVLMNEISLCSVRGAAMLWASLPPRQRRAAQPVLQTDC